LEEIFNKNFLLYKLNILFIVNIITHQTIIIIIIFTIIQ
jgi:hypothetical protein